MKKILTESEITDFLNKYCPGTVLKQSLGVTYVESVNDEPFKIVRETNGSEVSLTLIAYEYAFMQEAFEKFERLNFHNTPTVSITNLTSSSHCVDKRLNVILQSHLPEMNINIST